MCVIFQPNVVHAPVLYKNDNYWIPASINLSSMSFGKNISPHVNQKNFFIMYSFRDERNYIHLIKLHYQCRLNLIFATKYYGSNWIWYYTFYHANYFNDFFYNKWNFRLSNDIEQQIMFGIAELCVIQKYISPGRWWLKIAYANQQKKQI